MKHQGPDRPVKRQATKAAEIRRVPVRDLLRDANEIIIEHKGQSYNLRITRNDKLILTK
jgi:hemin uptake protein HemP